MLEILVSLFVMSIALLGIANLQLAGLRFAQDNTYRTQAILLALDMSQRILANQAATGVAGGSESYHANATAANVTSTNPLDCRTVDCTATALANYDVAVWRMMIADRIPNGTGEIEGDDGINYTITVEWWDRAAEAGTEQVEEQVSVTIPTL